MDAFYEIVMLRTGHFFFFKEMLTGSDTIAGIAVFLQETMQTTRILFRRWGGVVSITFSQN